MNQTKIGFIGFGLIGGSLARSLRQAYPDITLYAYQTQETDSKQALAQAIADGVLQGADVYLDEHFPDCDIIFLCAPIAANITYLRKLKGIVKKSCIITDVGSVKSSINQVAAEIGLAEQFIGGHPMAGSEKTGYENSTAHMFENAYYLLTPSRLTSPEAVAALNHIIRDIRAIPITLSCEEHDNITAAVSHVPHLIAAALVNLVKEHDNEQEQMHTFAAGGFKDITRIASSSPQMWQSICNANPENIDRYLEYFKQSLTTMQQHLRVGDETFFSNVFDTAREYRNSIPNKNAGMIHRQFEVYVDIIDETGAIATIATILASNAISIKNIGILHNREFEQGVLRIELYDDTSCRQASELLKQHRYHIYAR